MSQFATAIKEVRDAKEVILVLTRRVYSSTQGDAVRTLIHDMGIGNLVFAYNTVAKYRAPSKQLDADAFPVRGFPSRVGDLERYTDQLDLVVAWLDDPFLYDSRPELREGALVNLDKAMMILENVIEFVSNPRY